MNADVFPSKPTSLAATLCLATLCASAAPAPPRPAGPEAAREQLKTMTVADGLEVALFASEPTVRNPVAMDIDARGRIWITEGVNYRSSFQKWGRLQPEGDRILILEDTDGDGASDKQTTFYQGNDINTALGICVLGNKVIISCSPNVFLFTDTDGDDKADKKETLFTGISGVDHDHGVHSFVFGPDGKLYFNQGDAGRQIKRPDGSPITDRAGNEVANHGRPYRKGLVFRCNLDGTDFETLGHNFRNNYEVCVDSFGTLWQSDNDDDGNKGVRFNYVMEFGNYGYTDELTGAGWQTKRTNLEQEIPRRHWHLNDPGVVPTLLLTGAGSPTGILIYEGKLLPPVFHNQVIHCDAGPNVVRAYPVENDGAGYKAGLVDILTSSDKWYRPADVCVAPDGSLYVTDWNDAGVGGHFMVDQKVETMTGRIYRVAPKGHKPSVPKLDLASADGCVEALQSPNHARRYLAWTKLHEMQGRAERALLKLWQGHDPRMRARAFHLLARIQGQERSYLEHAAKDNRPDLRVAALRYVRSEKMDPIPLVKNLVKDPSPQVRRECALSLRHSSSEDAPPLWAALAQQHDGKDRWYLEALGIGADQHWDKYLEAWLKLAGDHWNTPAGRDIIWRSRSTKTPALLVKIILDKNTAENEKPQYLRSMDFVPKCPEKDAALAELALASLK